ncbi:MAG: transglycosylase SLT domain-containing protein [Prevotella sp.]|nr:transglycosylase SLT domain-containing protein [Prevotella sp.]
MIDKNYIKILSFAALLFSSAPLSAQTILDDPEDDEEEVDSLFVPIEDEISVVDKQGNTEFIDFPEAMTYNLDSLMSLYMSKKYLSMPGDCEMKDENPVFTPEEYIDRLRRMPTVMEMGYNDIVQRFIDRYMARLRHSVSYMLGATNFYVPIFEEALEAYQVPLELKYLPVIESALNPRAVSRVGATGLWQFMLGTGKQYGLEVNSLVDERRDPVRSSYAAARYLRDLYRIFGDWNLVIAAYNCGPGNINKAIHRSGGEKDYWRLYPYLPAETRGYVPAFIAANYAMTYYCEHGICPMSTKLPLQTDTVVVNRDVHLEQIAKVLDLDIEMLRSLNPQYRRDIVPGNTKKYAIRLPMADTGRFIDMQDSIYSYRASELLTKRAVVDVNDDQPTFRKKVVKRGRRSSIRKGRNARRGKATSKSRRGKASKSRRRRR